MAFQAVEPPGKSVFSAPRCTVRVSARILPGLSRYSRIRLAQRRMGLDDSPAIGSLSMDLSAVSQGVDDFRTAARRIPSFTRTRSKPSSRCDLETRA